VRRRCHYIRVAQRSHTTNGTLQSNPLRFDRIQPDRFRSDELLVIAVDLDGLAKAYPVGYLNRREMVLDRHRGIPTLVTW